MSNTSAPSNQPLSIPIIDFSPWIAKASKEARDEVSRKLVKACRDVGFAQIINYGVPQDRLREAFAISKRLFDLPQDEKMKAPHPPGWAHHRGYSKPGLEKVSSALSKDDDQAVNEALRKTTDCKESYEIGSDLYPDQPNIWLPRSSLPEFRPFMTDFYWTCFQTSRDILKALACGLGLDDENHLLRLHSGLYNQLRLLHYPPIPAKAIEDGEMARMPAHTDWSSITLLFQDDCGGLEIEDPKTPGKFIPANPVKGALVMNVGDLLMRWSNDQLKSTSHRVVLPPLSDRFSGDKRLTRARYSIVYFLTTDPDLSIECLPACVTKDRPPKYKPITQRDYAAMRARMQY